MKKQGLTVSIKQLKNLIKELEEQAEEEYQGVGVDIKHKGFLVGIINKTPKYSDTWELE